MISIPDIPSFDVQELCDDTGTSVAIGVRSLLVERKQSKRPPPGDQDYEVMDEDLDDQHCLDELEKEIDGMGGNDLFPGTDNSSVRFVIRWTRRKRDATQHNDFPLLNSELHNYLSAAAILMGPSMVDCPQSLADVLENLKTVQLVPLSINALSKWPK